MPCRLLHLIGEAISSRRVMFETTKNRLNYLVKNQAQKYAEEILCFSAGHAHSAHYVHESDKVIFTKTIRQTG